jgi:signal transduction histidine kinase
LYELAKTEASLGNYKPAYDRLMEYKLLADTLFEKKTAKEIAALEAKHQIAENEKKLLRLQNRNQLQQLLLYFGAGVVVLLIIFSLYLHRLRKKRVAQQLHAIRQQQEIQITRAQLEGEERERRRLARDLHDGLGGMLAGVKLKLSAIGHEKENRQQEDLERVIGQLDDSVHELRRIARNMMPETLLRSGLGRALEDLCKWMANDRMRVEYELLNLPEGISHNEKIDIYRIVQELLANAAKHAGAEEVFLQCSGREGRFYITIEDNGNGMPEKYAAEGMGLANIRSRVEYMQGKMELDSHPGKGTIINIEINVTANGKH